MDYLVFGSLSSEMAEAARVAWGASHVFWWTLAFAASIAAMFFARKFYTEMMAADPGDENMIKIAGYVSDGARAYLKQQYMVVTGFFCVIFLLLCLLAFVFEVQSPLVPFAFITGGFFSGLAGFFGMKTATAASNRTAAAARSSLNQALQIAFRSGAVMGLVVVGLGLIDITLWFAGLYFVVPNLGFDPLSLEDITVTMLCFGMGASSQALFARVGGGIFTKAADVGADLVGKVEAGIPEDDPRNPATIADNVGDNVGDVAGMGADLYESYCGSILASAALGVAAMATKFRGDEAAMPGYQLSAILFPMALAGVGILISVIGIFRVKTEENADQKTLLKALNGGIMFSGIIIAIAAFVLAILMFGIEEWQMATALGGSVFVGLLAGVAIGHWTEVSTSEIYKPTREIADQAQYGPATVIIAGVAEGMKSTWFPTIMVCLAMLFAYGLPTGFKFSDPGMISLGLYGIGVAAVGMLSTLGITLATDAYGPIADNAGGNAEMTHQDPQVRKRTDALDSLGNTTAATGKGFAIGSAALTALALLAAYVEEVRVGYIRWGQSLGKDSAYVAQVEEATPSGGLPITKSVVLRHETVGGGSGADGEAASETEGEKLLVPYLRFALDPNAEELQYRYVRMDRANMRDFADALDLNIMNPKFLVGILAGAMLVFTFSAMTMKAVGRSAGKMVAEVRRQFQEIPGIMEGEATPDYASCVKISTLAAQKEMILPSLLGLAAPVFAGFLLGVAGVMGMLGGVLSAGFTVAVMMANAGGAWDNAKKYIEGGAHGGKGSDAHKAGVVGDTVGDPFKDTSGPSINILIKLMNMVSVVAAGFVIKYSLDVLLFSS